MTFDYVQAWTVVARPAFEALPANIRALVDRVAIEAEDLHQLRDLSMPWPTTEVHGQTLRQQFDKIDAEWLALAAHVVYHAGHWHPGISPRLPVGQHWKFSHYCDQVLRGRLGLPENGETDGTMIQYKLIEGVIRVCYSSRNAWQWAEVAPGTAKGIEAAHAIGNELAQQVTTRAATEGRDEIAWTFFQSLNTRKPLKAWPGWEAWADTGRFQCSEDDLKRREAARRPPVDREKLIAQIKETRDARIAKATIEANGHIWLIERGLPDDNAIYYSHTGRWAFGWRTPLTPEDRSVLLDHLSEFPYDYDFAEDKKR